MNDASDVRGFDPGDWPWIIALGNANQTETGPLDEPKLAHMSREACLTLAINDDAFLIAFDQDSDYDSPNFLWLRERYGNFVYVDRIVVAEAARKLGYGRALYQHVISEGREARYERVVCEVNLDPPNPVSDAFHARLGFTEIGRATLANGKTVRYLERKL